MTMEMEPASSSDDDSAESSPQKHGGGRVEGLVPVGSDDDSSDGSGEQHVSNFDDLPTDDSEDESHADSDSEDDGLAGKQPGNRHTEGSSDDEYISPEDVPLGERVARRAREGRRYRPGNDDVGRDGAGKTWHAETKRRALERAAARLREARQEQGAKKEQKVDLCEDSSNGRASSNHNRAHCNEKPPRKKSKHAPTEMSSKRCDYFARGRPDLNSSGLGVSIGANKYKARDPRMTSLSGHLDADVFERRYGFLDQVQDKEIKQLQKRVNAWTKTGKKGQRERRRLGITQDVDRSLEDDREELTRLLQERAERHKAKVVRGAKRAVKQKIREDVAAGKRGAYYPKRSELKRMEAEAKYEEIRKRGGSEAVDKAIAKRRKKNLSKAAKQMPNHKV